MRYALFDRYALLQLFKPVLHQDHFDYGRGLLLFSLDHEKPLPIEGQVPGTYWDSTAVSGLLKKQPGLADGNTTVCPDISDPNLILQSVKKLFAISCPQRLRAPPRLIPGISSGWLE